MRPVTARYRDALDAVHDATARLAAARVCHTTLLAAGMHATTPALAAATETAAQAETAREHELAAAHRALSPVTAELEHALASHDELVAKLHDAYNRIEQLETIPVS